MKLHKHQLTILKKLMYTPDLRFSDLQDQAITSEHFTYHLKQLIEKGLINKVANKYYLTNEGKNYVGTLDERNLKEEKNPKVSVLVYIRRKNKNGEYEYLMNRRLKQPYFGKVGNLTGKVRFGETFKQAAQRELKEETGLEAKLEFRHIYHKIRFDKNDVPLQDSVFAVFLANNPKGNLIKQKDGKMFWTTLEALFKRHDLFDDVKSNLEKVLNGKCKFVEGVQKAQDY
jgi:ADP-ribose pyrophosphatase YjhB (NUDIX family)